jgi:hypothetical protein
MTSKQLEVLVVQDEQTLAAWWCELNSWEWPKALPDPEPNEYIRGGVRSQIMHWIDNKIGHRAVLRFHNKNMPDEVFGSFWRNDREPGTPYGDWLTKKVNERMARMRVRDDEVLASDIVLESALDAELIG